jgi:hypothetical protein
MRFPKSIQVATLAALVGGFVATAQAQTTVFNENFDGGYTGAFGTSQYFGGAPTSYGNSVVSSGGNPNGAWTETMTTTTWSDYYAGQLQLMTVSGNADPIASHYTLTFDAYGSRAANIQLGLQSWQNNYFGGSQLISTTLNDLLGAANTWQTFSVNLGTISGANPTGATWQLNFQMNSWEWGGPGNVDTLTIDNIVLTQVPEPGIFALAGLGAALLLIFRRR